MEAIPSITKRQWWWMGLRALVLGLFVYVAVTSVAYWHAFNVVRTATPSFAEGWVPPGTREKGANKAAELLSRHLGIEYSSLGSRDKKRIDHAYGSLDTPALQAAAMYLRDGYAKSPKGVAASDCEDDIRAATRNALARLLIGWPADTSKDYGTLRRFFEPEPPENMSDDERGKRTIENCNSFSWDAFWTWPIPSYRILWDRTESVTGRHIAVKIMGADSCVPGGQSAEAAAAESRCRILQALLESAAGANASRNARMWANFWWGWERLAVLVLAFAIFRAMRSLKRQRRPLQMQASDIETWLRVFENVLSRHRLTVANFNAKQAATKLYGQFCWKFGVKLAKVPADGRFVMATEEGDLFDAQHAAEAPKAAKIVCLDSDGLCLLKSNDKTALRDLIDANRECVDADDRSHLEKLVELHTQALGRQRAFINALITAFPAIGLVATLHGLIVALSRASGIVAGTEPERFAATELVTGVLSSSFATTMLALTAMALCMLINTWEEHREAALLEDAHRRLISVFWPGRP